MKQGLLILFTFALLTGQAQKGPVIETPAARDARMQWWRDASFGMFIHWGAYAVPAGTYKGREVKGVGEWIMHSANIPIPEYEKFVAQFDPRQFNAMEWVRIAKNAGMKYIVITSKHHDGFSLWDSKVTAYDVMDASPFRRDILKELSDACKAEGIRLCFYHSIMDWHQPDAESKKEYSHQQSANPDWARYRETYLKPQLKELVMNYDPAVLWFDGEWIPEWTEEQGRELYDWLRSLKPSLIINNRVGKGRNGMQGMNAYAHATGDFGTPEQEILEGTSDLDWESCMTMNDTWGFKRSDTNWKSAKVLIDNLIDIAAKGGNYLLNVGPDALGKIPEASVDRLNEMGRWLRVNGEAIYGTRARKQYREGNDIRFTESADGLLTYVIITRSDDHSLTISSIRPAPGSKIHMLGVKSPLQWKEVDGKVQVHLPLKRPASHAWVLRVRNQ